MKKNYPLAKLVVRRYPINMQVKSLALAVSIVATLSVPSCSNLVHSDSLSMRQHALEYYDTQAMDNLVRAAQGKLILHVDIDSLTAATKMGASGDLEAGRTSARTTAAGALSRVLTKPISGSLNSSIEGNLTLVAKPEVGAPELYAAYLQYLCLSSPKQKLSKVTDIYYDPNKWPEGILRIEPASKPLPGTYVEGTYIVRDNVGYCIPNSYRRAYFELCMALTGKVIISEPIDLSASAKVSASSGGKVKRRVPSIETPDKSVDKLIEDKARDEVLRQNLLK